MNIVYITIILILLFILSLAIFQFLKTPMDKRYKLPIEDKNATDPGYAPIYTKQERINLVLKYGSWILPFFIVMQYYFFPWLKEYAKNANCQFYFGESISGIQLLIFGTFALIPLSFAIVIILIEGKRSVKILKTGQNPLLNEKVLRPIKYKYGAAAKIQPFAIIIVIISLIFVSIWGGLQAQKLIKTIEPCVAKNV